MPVDLLIRGADGVDGDVAVDEGRIVAIGSEMPSIHEIDATGLTMLPGVIDVHVHFNEPGRTDWEGAYTGSCAFAAGGGTLYFDMPLNSSPCTVGVAEFDAKREALEAASVTDFALWGGLVPGNRGAMEGLAERGVIGFKAFLSDSGLAEFPRADDLTLIDGMAEAARLGLPVALHAESEELTRGLSVCAIAAGRTGIRDYLESRPVIAEVEAIERAALFARETGVKLHIVHISSGRGVAAALEARLRGTDISIETCPHYLFFTADDMERIGAVAKCAPPLRPAKDRDELLAYLRKGEIDIIGSDHSPAPLEMKRDANFFRVWGGIAGVQSTLGVLLELGVSIGQIGELLAANPARRFGVANKGRIAPGNDADVVLVDASAQYAVEAGALLQKHRLSPYIGFELQGRVLRTVLRGETIFSDGAIMTQGRGRLIRPGREHATTGTHT